MSWEIVSGIIGVLGFLLSLSLWIKTLLQEHINISLRECIFVPLDTQAGAFLLEGMLTNHSSKPLSVYKIGLEKEGNNVERTPSVYTTDLKTSQRTDISTALPVQLAPYCTQRVVLTFCPCNKGCELLHSLEGSNLSPDLQQNIFFPLWFYTSRGCVQFQVSCPVADPNQWFQTFAS